MRRGLVVTAGVVVAGLLIGGAQLWQGQARAKVTGTAELPEVNAILTSAPTVPPPVDRPGNAKVIVTHETTEAKVIQAHVQAAMGRARPQAPLQSRLDVANLVQVTIRPGIAEGFRIGRQFVIGATSLQRGWSATLPE